MKTSSVLKPLLLGFFVTQGGFSKPPAMEKEAFFDAIFYSER
jgi:hypothetical protein